MQGKTSEYQKALKLKRERFQEELESYSTQVKIRWECRKVFMN